MTTDCSFILLQTECFNFIGQIDASQWPGGQQVEGFNGQCEVYLQKFQDPTKSDAMSRLQTDLDDTKIILVSLKKKGLIFFIYLFIHLLFSTTQLRLCCRGVRNLMTW